MKDVKDKIIDYFNSLSDLDRLSIYMEYFIRQVSLKHDFDIRDDFSFKRLWKDISICSFEEYISNNNLVVIDNGDDFGKYGYAQRIRNEYNGIYEYIYHKIFE
jgi:hypothetical protein